MGPHLIARSRLNSGNGAVVVNADGSVSITPAANKRLTTTFALTAAESETLKGFDVVVSAASSFNSASGHGVRPIDITSTFTGTNGIGTHAGVYATVAAAHTAGTIGHLHAGAFRIQLSSTGVTTDGWGARADFAISAVHTASRLVGFGAVAPVITGNAVITDYIGLEAEAANMTGSTTTNAYGARIGQPTNAASKNVGVFIGSPTSHGDHAANLVVGTKGAIISGTPTVGTNTLNQAGLLIVQAGEPGSNNNSALVYFYRTDSAKAFMGITASTALTFGGHTKLVTDLLINAGNNSNGVLLDTNGGLYNNGVFGTSGASAASVPGVLANGTWFTGGTATTTKPHVLIEPDGTTSTNWSTSGTGIGVNAPNAFGGNLIDAQVNAVRKFTVNSSGVVTLADAANIVLGSTTGTKIGTATGQKLGFWNATPVVQQVLATGAGATADNIITFLQTLGLCKQS